MIPFRPLPSGVRRAILASCLGLALAAGSTASLGAAPLFTEVAPGPSARDGYPEATRFLAIDLAEMQAMLAAAPRESFTSPVEGLVLALPLPGGSSQDFAVWESPVLHPELAARFPEIRTYFGRGIDDRTATVRLDTTPLGFHAMILSAGPTVFIDPIDPLDPATYACHTKRSREAVNAGGEPFTCGFVTDEAMEREIARLVEERAARPASRATGDQLRTYRTAVACTGEYATRFGGTVPAALAAITTSVNRVTGVYERDVSVRLELIPNETSIIYTNAATDPYTNSNGGAMLSQNQANLDAVIGNANYDLGHVFSTGGGGIAGLGVLCRTGQKARGVTGLNNPFGDSFDIDYVAHEMGHQFGATHTFNSVAGSCAGNRTGSTAYEPGSGITIMGYAGICGADDLANHSIDEFHGGSLNQITAYTQSGFGATCAAVTATGNTPPTAVAGNAGFTIPIETPFLVTGTSSDADGDFVWHTWEEMDLGPAGPPGSPSGNAPIFRNFPSSERDWRSFPRMADIRDGSPSIGEILPTYSRNLTLRFTVRDDNGGMSFDQTSVAVTASAGPFLVTSIDATPWAAGTSKTITWDVAGTDAAPVSCANVDILLSEDDGMNFTIVLAAGTPNDGSEVVTVPNVSTIEARVQVRAADNLFLDLNDTAFEITGGGTGVEELADAADALQLRVQPNPFTSRTSVTFALARRGPVTVSVHDAAGRRVTTLLDASRDAGVHTVPWNGRDGLGSPVSAGVYFVRVETADGVRTIRSLRLR